MANPDCLAEKTMGTTSEVKKFKANLTIKGLKEYLNLCTAQTTKSDSATMKKAKRNLAEMLESDDDEEQREQQVEQQNMQQSNQSSTHKGKEAKKKKHAKV